MTKGPVHVSMVLVHPLARLGSVHGPFRGLPFDQFAYTDFKTPDSTLYGYRLPFEDCGTFALGHEVEPRRFVVPDVLLALPDTPNRTRLIEALAALFCAALLDNAHRSFEWFLTGRDSDFAKSWQQYLDEVRQLLTRFDVALGLLTPSPLASMSAISLLRGIPDLAKAMAQAMRVAFGELIQPTLLYQEGRLKALNIRTEFTPQQWLSHLRLACRAALGELPEFPPLPRLQGNPTSGYVLALDDIEPAQWLDCPPPQNQPGAMHQACAR